MKETIEIKKANGERVCISPREYKGKKYVDFRVWYEQEGKLLPTKKGFILTVAEFEELRKRLLDLA